MSYARGVATSIALGLLSLACVGTAWSYQTRWVDTFVNPLDVSLADPGVLKDGNTYYVYSVPL